MSVRPGRAELALLVVGCVVAAGLAEAFFRVHSYIAGTDAMALRVLAPAGTSRTLQAGWATSDPHVLHPYLGYVVDRDQVGDVNRFGWYGLDPTTPKPTGTLRVFVTGGSVAADLLRGEQVTTALAAASPGQRFELAGAAVGGYKQPQHLLALTYVLSLGVRPDIVVNLDGFNEVALPVTENWPYGVTPYFPRSWNLRSHTGYDDQTFEAMTRARTIAASRKRLREAAGLTLARRSALVRYILWSREQSLAADAFVSEKDLNSAFKRTQTFQSGGPAPTAATAQDVIHDSAAMWRQSSEQMNRLCESNGILYLHFLQPNQYVAGSKWMSPAERAIAIARAGGPYQQAVETGYERLREEGRTLARSGVRFFDMTLLFAAERAAVYRDDCCHFNDRGLRMLAEEIARQSAAARPPAAR